MYFVPKPGMSRSVWELSNGKITIEDMKQRLWELEQKKLSENHIKLFTSHTDVIIFSQGENELADLRSAVQTEATFNLVRLLEEEGIVTFEETITNLDDSHPPDNYGLKPMPKMKIKATLKVITP